MLDRPIVLRGLHLQTSMSKPLNWGRSETMKAARTPKGGVRAASNAGSQAQILVALASDASNAWRLGVAKPKATAAPGQILHYRAWFSSPSRGCCKEGPAASLGLGTKCICSHSNEKNSLLLSKNTLLRCAGNLVCKLLNSRPEWPQNLVPSHRNPRNSLMISLIVRKLEC